MRLFLLFYLFFSFPAWSQVSFTLDVRDTFNSQDQDLIKKNLLFKAAQMAAEKMAPEFGVDYKEFKKNLDQRFQGYLTNYQTKKMSERFGADYVHSLTPEAKKKFLDSLVEAEGDLLMSFSGYLGPVSSYSFKTFSPPPTGSNDWSSSVDLVIDKAKMQRLFGKIMGHETGRHPRILLITEVETIGFGWEQLNLTDFDQFINPVHQSWLKWMSEQFKSISDDVQVCDKKCIKFFQDWSSAGPSMLAPPIDFTDSLILKVHFFLKKESENSQLHETVFSWEGRFNLIDINTKKNLASFTLPFEKRVFRSLDQKTINSALASGLYKAPLTSFLQLKTILESSPVPNQLKIVGLSGFHHLGDVMGFIDFLKNRGSSLGLEVGLTSFSKEGAFLSCYFRGEEKSFSDLLSGLKEIKLSHPYVLMGDFSGGLHRIKFLTESP